jgi:sugar/nucleoside kinase (ribokinase family)
MVVQLVTIGHILSETVVFADGSREGPVLGGPPAYCGLVASKLGTPTGVVTKVSARVFDDLLSPLKEAQVDLSGVDRASEITTTNELIYSADGTKELKYLKQAPMIGFQDIPQSYHEAQLFHVCPLDYEVPVETVFRIKHLGKLVSIDLGGYGGAHVRRETMLEKRMTTTQLGEFIGSVDIVKASDEDADLIFANDSRSGEQRVQQFVDWGARIGILTCGARGSLVFTKERKWKIPALAGKVTNVTGGGDSFMGGFLTEYLLTGDPWLAGLFASAVALCVIERTGGVSVSRMPTAEQARLRIPTGIRPELL